MIIIDAILAALKMVLGLFSSKEPVKNPIVRPEPEVPTDADKTDKERLNDLGL